MANLKTPSQPQHHEHSDSRVVLGGRCCDSCWLSASVVTKSSLLSYRQQANKSRGTQRGSSLSKSRETISAVPVVTRKGRQNKYHSSPHSLAVLTSLPALNNQTNLMVQAVDKPTGLSNYVSSSHRETDLQDILMSQPMFTESHRYLLLAYQRNSQAESSVLKC